MSEITARRLQVARLQAVMRSGGWEIAYMDLDLTQSSPVAEIRVNRDDGRWLLARVDQLGRATIERFQRHKALGKPTNTKGRQPLAPVIEDQFLGRMRGTGARAMLRSLTEYIAENAMYPLALRDVRGAWAAVMSSPLRLESASQQQESHE